MPKQLLAPVLIALAAIALPTAASAKAPDANAAYLQKNAKKKGVVALPGLQYEILKSGPADGVSPKLSDDVTVHYEGKLVDGTIFDSSFAKGEPVTFPLRPLIPGWGTALRLMRPGDEWIISVPAEMAYGAAGVGPIPGGSVLIFRIQLISHKPTPKPAPSPAN
jgi:peptidylprolyl isomerase/FKBP-type peptidyl-prolyl cis-trans isomerase FklB